MTDFRLYTTKEGQRWDAIAYANYSDPFQVATILQDNPTQIGKLSPDVGTQLRIRVLPTVRAIPTIKPPWDR